MPNINRDISFLMNNVQIGDDILSPISGSPARVNFSTPIVQNDNQEQKGIDSFPGVEKYLDPRELLPQNFGTDIVNAVSPTIESVTGLDKKTLAKYTLLAILALILITIGLIALITPGVRYVEKIAEASA